MPNLPLRTKVETRRSELEKALETLDPADTRSKTDIDNALRALSRLLTGDLDKIPDAVAKDLARWLETSKYLGKKD